MTCQCGTWDHQPETKYQWTKKSGKNMCLNGESNMSLRSPQLLPRWLRLHRVPHPSCILAGFARGQKLDPSAVQPSEFVMHEISPTWCMLHRTWEQTERNKEGSKRCGPLYVWNFIRWTREVRMIPQLVCLDNVMFCNHFPAWCHLFKWPFVLVRKMRHSYAWNVGERWWEEVVGNIMSHPSALYSKSNIGK